MFTFKNYEDYKAQRNGLLKEAESLLNEGKTEEYERKVEEVNLMDEEYEIYAQNQANLEALRGSVKVPLSVMGTARVIDSLGMDEEMDYRIKFMNYVLKGEPIRMKNADETTVTTDVGTVIPNTIIDRIVERMEKTGNILAKVTRTFYKGGVSVPTADVKPTATWTAERGTTDKQKKDTGSITFSYYKLKVQVAVSLIVENVTLEVFERTIAANITEAITKALETAIINGTGNGQPKGILTEKVPEGQNVELKAGGSITYADICKAEGELPSAYDDAFWCMKKSTFMSQILGMVDANKQPIARVNSGISGKPEYTILGRQVEFSEDMPAFSGTAPDADTVVAFIFRFADYMLNTNMGITVSRYTDQETDDEITKAIMLADGKVIDLNSLVTVTAKAAG